MIGRVLRTGLLGKAQALFHGLGRKGEHPSRENDDWQDHCGDPGCYICTGHPSDTSSDQL